MHAIAADLLALAFARPPSEQKVTPRQAVEAVLETLPLADRFTVDEGERRSLLAWATRNGRPPLGTCPCTKTVLVEEVPGIWGAVPVEDRGVWTTRGILCGACHALADSEEAR